MKHFIEFVLVSVTVFLLLGCASQEINVSRFSNREVTYQSQAADYTELVKKNPGNAELRYALAFLLYKSQQLDAALNAIQDAISQEPFKAKYYTLLGQIYFDKQSYVSAQQSFNLAIRYQTTLIDAHIGLIRTLEEEKDYPKAKSVIETALLIDPDNFALQILSVRIESKILNTTSNHLKLIDRAKILFRKDPQNVDVLLLLVKLNEEIGLDAAALHFLQNSWPNFQNQPLVRDKLCLLLVGNNQLKEAENLLNQYSSQIPKSLSLFLCQILTELYQNPEKAVQDFEQNQKNFQPGEELDKIGVLLYIQQENYQVALRSLENLYFITPEPSFELNYLLAYTNHQLKNYAGEEKYLNNALALEPNNFDAKLLHINWLLKTGRLEDAYNAYFNENFPLENPKTLEILGNIYLSQNNLYQAEKYYTLSNQMFFSVGVALKLAELRFIQGYAEQALQTTKDLLYIKPRATQVMLQLVRYSYYLKNYNQVVQILAKKPEVEKNLEFGLFLGLSYLHLKNTEKGINLLKQTAVNYPGDLLLIDQLSASLGRQKRYLEAIPYLEVLLANSRSDTLYLYERLADYYELAHIKGKYANAEKSYFER